MWDLPLSLQLVTLFFWAIVCIDETKIGRWAKTRLTLSGLIPICTLSTGFTGGYSDSRPFGLAASGWPAREFKLVPLEWITNSTKPEGLQCE
jgi:hypothetical protein